ncbi:tautomerase family protein [Asticcacaulis sp. 201]|uniref:tautomerase family protein n=1 Tax=Asticcacaulis sp. 201 TaxID=3028787 RepID=UPI002916AF26|nr:tautomerase family protein [Asticcacaulis sp. 201]MDV6330796.1 tautomerase family protein [Asticcacaulis sp. 201]
MPSTLISTRAGWIDSPAAVFDAVQTALTESIGTPAHARHIRLVQYPPDHFTSGEGEGERYTNVEVTLFSGRTPELKQALFAAVKRNLGALGVPEQDVKVILIESPKENWS